LEIKGNDKDYMHMKYEGSEKVYVRVEEIDEVEKYVGCEGKEGKVYKLGGNEWKKVKGKVECCVEEMGDELIKLYGEGEGSKGYGFCPDGDL
ncbi:CarD family transcriptional regulator, partial [Priestia megaterium]|uniref:CarD family transcriptional regulator n=1 Tax=Priestia megaterium TaxID=1404 RepID=UPI0012B6B8D5